MGFLDDMLDYELKRELFVYLKARNTPPPAKVEEKEPPPCEKVVPEYSFDDLVIPPSMKDTLDTLMEEHEHEAALLEHGIKARKTAIFHGPPGCGKTSVAHALAKAMKLDLHYISVADTLSAYIGDSEKNVAKTLEFAHQHKVLLLLDEFDSLAAKRIQADVAGATSNNRIVNQFLVGLDQKPPKGLIVACTNFYDAIDPAVKRRFKLTIEVPAATPEVLRKIAAKCLKSSLDPDIDQVLAECSTPAQVSDMCADIRRRRVLKERKMKKIELPGVDSERRIRQLAGGK